MTRKPRSQVEILIYRTWAIRHFLVDHNAPCFPPNICTTIVFNFSWDDCNTQERLETVAMQKFGHTGCIMVNEKIVNLK